MEVRASETDGDCRNGADTLSLPEGEVVGYVLESVQTDY